MISTGSRRKHLVVVWVTRPGENHSMCKEPWVGIKATTKAFLEKKVYFSFLLTDPMSRRTGYSRYCESPLLSCLGQGCLDVQLVWGRKVGGFGRWLSSYLEGKADMWVVEECFTTLSLCVQLENEYSLLSHSQVAIGGVYTSHKSCNAEYFPQDKAAFQPPTSLVFTQSFILFLVLYQGH